MANLLSEKGLPLSSLVRPLDVYLSTGEINIRITDFAAVETALEARCQEAEKDWLARLTCNYPE